MTIKKALLRGFLGVPIGVFIMTLVGLVISLTLGKLTTISPDHLGNASDLTVYTIQFALGCLMGFAFAISSTYFEVENWSIAKQTLLHFITISIIYFPASIYLGWVEFKLLAIIIFVGIFILIYVTIWLTQYVILKKKINSLNDGLKKR